MSRASLCRRSWTALGIAAGGAAIVVGAWLDAVRLGSVDAGLFGRTGRLSLTVLDRSGEVLRRSAGGEGGRQQWVPLARIAPIMRRATLAAEDQRFFDHGGVDWIGVLRAAGQNVRRRRLVSGASTITMQLARLVRPHENSLPGKLEEAIMAARIERVLTKEAILEQYLNRVYFGGGAWGVDAAARRYFDKPPHALSLGEAALLAVLPRNPARYFPYRHFSRAVRRRNQLLRRMADLGWISAAEHQLALTTPLELSRRKPDFVAGHFVDHVLARLPAAHRRGARVRTTLDRPLQRAVEVALRAHLRGTARLNLTQAAVVVLRNRDGAILAMVGSRDYLDAEGNGAHNAVTARLRPGSTLKPFVYGLALELGDSPATVALDVFLPADRGKEFARDTRQHGPARYREALAGSYNLAAIHTLRRVGVHRLVDRLRAAGLSTLDRPDHRYDEGLAVGHAEVRLLELAAAFAAFGNRGRPITPRAIVESELPRGGETWRPGHARRAPIFSEQVAYQVYDMLQDPDARLPMFGRGVPLELPFRVALKTGTTRAYTDNWALGTTRDFTVGVWAGNFDGSPTHHVMSMRGATPLLRAAFVAVAHRFGEPAPPARPEGLRRVKVCAQSGMRPGPHCPHRKLDLFVAGRLPQKTCTWHRQRCGRLFTAYPEALQTYLRAKGRLPGDPCGGQHRRLRIVSPVADSRYVLETFRPAAHQRPPLLAIPEHPGARWTIDGVPAARWVPTPGEHRVRVEQGGQRDEVRIRYEL
jgi:penicillin-binding protein 1C